MSPQGLKWAVDPVADVVTTAGDLIYGTAADTVTRLGIGTAGQVLKVNSGATAPEWGAASSTPTFSGASVYKSAILTIANNTGTAVTFGNEDFDTDGYHSTVTNTSRMTIPSGKDGKFLVIGRISYVGNNTGVRQARIYKNGNLMTLTVATPSSSGCNLETSGIFSAVAGDYFEVYTFQTSGGNLDTEGASVHNDALYIEYLGA